MEVKENRRLFTRVDINLHVEVAPGQERTFTGTIRNLSLNGMFVVCDACPPCGVTCHATICLEGGGGVLPVGVGGTIVRADAGGVAVAFTRISPDGFGHLRRLVLYNATDADQVEQELARSVGLKPL